MQKCKVKVALVMLWLIYATPNSFKARKFRTLRAFSSRSICQITLGKKRNETLSMLTAYPKLIALRFMLVTQTARKQIKADRGTTYTWPFWPAPFGWQKGQVNWLLIIYIMQELNFATYEMERTAVCLALPIFNWKSTMTTIIGRWLETTTMRLARQSNGWMSQPWASPVSRMVLADWNVADLNITNS